MSSLFRRIFHRCKNHLEHIADMEQNEHIHKDGTVCFRQYFVTLSRCKVCGKIIATKSLIKPV